MRPSSNHRCSVLVVDDESHIVTTLSRLLAKDFDVITAESGERAHEILQRREVDIVLSDLRMPGMSGVQLLEWVHRHHPKTQRLLMTGLGKYEDAVEAINSGQVSHYVFKPWRADELLEVLRAAGRSCVLERNNAQLLDQLRKLNAELEDRVKQRTAELEDANQQLQQKNWMLEMLALTDPLTGLPNRRAMDRLVKSELRRRVRYHAPLAIGIIDADHFKEVNAKHLLTGGDQVLIGLAKTLLGSQRTVDSVGRIGGEEFLLVAPETNADGAAVLGERVRSAVEQARFPYNDVEIAITVSIGFAVVEEAENVEYEQMKLVAAGALEHAKTTGRNRVVIRRIDDAVEQVG